VACLVGDRQQKTPFWNGAASGSRVNPLAVDPVLAILPLFLLSASLAFFALHAAVAYDSSLPRVAYEKLFHSPETLITMPPPEKPPVPNEEPPKTTPPPMDSSPPGSISWEGRSFCPCMRMGSATRSAS
jgi:hypothetical protein